MAYRRRQGITRASTFKEETYHLPHTHDDGPPTDFQDHDNVSSYSSSSSSSSSSSDSLAARAIRASAAHRDSSAYGYAYAAPTADSFSSSAASPLHRDFNILSGSKGQVPLESSSVKNQDESKYGLWGILARKAKAILENETDPQQFGGPNRMRSQTTDASPGGQFYQQQSPESGGKIESPRLRKGLDAITSSLNHIGDTIGNALEEGRAIVEHKTADILQETRKLQSRRKGLHSETRNQSFNLQNSWQQPGTHPIQVPVQSNHETQLKASRDVAMATAAKAKLLLRELKTTKADLAFAKERCAQLEEENKRLRESKEKSGNNSNADDDLIRLQLETLLAEKARLAHENSIYARENRFLREIVEYHQLTMQDLIYLDEGSEEVSEVYPRASVDDDKGISSSPTSPTSPPVDVLLHDITPPSCPPPENKEYTAAEIFLSGCAPDKKERLELEATNLKRDCVNQQRSETSSISRLVIPMSEDTKRPPAVSPSQVWIG